MALKKVITQTEYDALDEAGKKFYVKQTDGKFHLDLEEDDAAELRRAKDHEKTKRQEAEAARDEANRKLQEITDAKKKADEEAARASGDVTALEKSWKEKRDADVAAETAKRERAEAALKKQLVDNVAQRIANEISTAPSLLVEIIKKRLAVEIPSDPDSEPLTRVLDVSGKPSALSVNDLKQEFIDNTEFAAIMKGSSASGGGATNQQKGGGAPTGKKKLSEMTATEEAQFANENPEEYKKLIG